MLYLVLILVIVAFGLLIAALTTANTLFAWISVGISVVAAVLLIFDWLQGRRRVAATSTGGVSTPERVEDQIDEVDEPEGTAPELEQPEPAQPAEPVAAQSPPTGSAEAPDVAGPPPDQDDEEPAEEATDAADLLVVSELTVEVRVVDEHPRYHLTHCTWLSGRPTIPITVAEARQLGFTPCARCGPDAVLAAKHRSTAGRGGTT